jgi:hypothetical protein
LITLSDGCLFIISKFFRSNIYLPKNFHFCKIKLDPQDKHSEDLKKYSVISMLQRLMEILANNTD